MHSDGESIVSKVEITGSEKKQYKNRTYVELKLKWENEHKLHDSPKKRIQPKIRNYHPIHD